MPKKLNALDMNDHQKYDSIGAFDVIEHIENDGLALSNLSKALKRNGCLLVTVPQHKWLWSVTDMNAGHFRRYSRKELIKKVTGTGLKVEFSTSFVSLLIPFMFLNRLFKFQKTDQSEEFLISATLNFTLKSIMYVEILLIKYGIKIPLGGSLLLVARKTSMIPFNKPVLSGKEIEYILEAVESGQLAGDGKFTEACQSYINQLTGCNKSLLTHSCTAALEMTALIAEIGPGDEIIMPSYTFVSTANAFCFHGATPYLLILGKIH